MFLSDGDLSKAMFLSNVTFALKIFTFCEILINSGGRFPYLGS